MPGNPLETVPEGTEEEKAPSDTEEIEVDSQPQSAVPLQMSELEGTPSATDLHATVPTGSQTQLATTPVPTRGRGRRVGAEANSQPPVRPTTINYVGLQTTG